MRTTRATAKEVQKNFGRFQDEALKGPVIVTNNGREKTVMISMDEFDRMRKNDRRVRSIQDMSEDEIMEIARGLEEAAAKAPLVEGE